MLVRKKKTIFYEALCKTANLKKKGGGGYPLDSFTLARVWAATKMAKFGDI